MLWVDVTRNQLFLDMVRVAFQEDRPLQKKIKLFIDVLQSVNASETEVREACLKLMVRMYGGKE